MTTSFVLMNNRIITSVRIVFLILTLACILSGCQKENSVPRDYPRIKDTQVTEVTDSGAVFSADLYSLGNEKTEGYGFVWGIDQGLDITRFNKVYLGVPDRTGIFSAEAKNALKKGQLYYVKPYVKTEMRVVYGPVSSFTSLGGKAPVITGFAPDSASWLDTLRISGKNFSWSVPENIILLNSIACQVVSSTDTSLKFIINSEVSDKKNHISVEVAGKATVFNSKEFILIIPAISKIIPHNIRWGDTVSVIGTNLNTAINRYSVTIGGTAVNIFKKLKDTIKVIVPNEQSSISNLVAIKANNINLAVPDKLTLLPPYISDFYPKEGTWATIVTFRGLFNPIKAKNSILIGGYGQDIISNNKDSIRIFISSGVSGHDNPVRLSSGPFNISADTFRLFGPYIKSVTPMSGPSGLDVTIRGKYLRYLSEYYSQVYFDGKEAWMASVSDTVIKCKVPDGTANGPVNVSVKVNAQTSVFKDNFNIENAVITNVYPLSGFYGDEITVEGNHLTFEGRPAQFYFTDQPNYSGTAGEIVSFTDTKAVIKVPQGLDSIPKYVVVGLGWSRQTYFQQFVLDPPEITGISSPLLTPGTDITIYGKNFNPVQGGNQVFWGAYGLQVKSSTTTEITASVPLYISRGLSKLSMKSAGYKRSYPDYYEFKSQWNGIWPVYSFNWFAGPKLGQPGVAFSSGNIGYMIDPLNGQMISYDPNSGIFTNLGQFDVTNGEAGTVLNDTLYRIGNYIGIRRYDKNANAWVGLASLPANMIYGVSFSFNNKIYFGLGFDLNSQTLDNRFWVFDTKTKIWESKNNFPWSSSSAAVSWLTIGNKAYLVLADKGFYEYDPSSDSWTQLSSFPASGTNRYGMTSFVLDNKVYCGMGGLYFAESGTDFDDFWMFDPQTGLWTESTHMPWGGRYNSLSFVINNKAYVGFGYKSGKEMKDLFEFDPNYPM